MVHHPQVLAERLYHRQPVTRGAQISRRAHGLGNLAVKTQELVREAGVPDLQTEDHEGPGLELREDPGSDVAGGGGVPGGGVRGQGQPDKLVEQLDQLGRDVEGVDGEDLFTRGQEPSHGATHLHAMVILYAGYSLPDGECCYYSFYRLLPFYLRRSIQ